MRDPDPAPLSILRDEREELLRERTRLQDAIVVDLKLRIDPGRKREQVELIDAMVAELEEQLGFFAHEERNKTERPTPTVDELRQPPGEWLSVREAALVAGTSDKTIRKWIREDRLRQCRLSDKPGAHIRIKRADLEAALRASKEMPQDDPAAIADRIVAELTRDE